MAGMPGSRSLSILKDACIACASNKISERKKAAECIKSQLENSRVIAALDVNSDSEDRDRLFGWDMVFEGAKNFVMKELEKIQKDETKASSKESTRTTLENLKRYCASFMRFVVRKANERGPKLPISALMEHVFEVLVNPISRNAFGRYYIAMLDSNILPYRENWTTFEKQTWEDLLSCAIRFHREAPADSDLTLSLRVISTILRLSSISHDLSDTLQKRSDFVLEILDNVKNPAAQLEALNLLNNFCEAMEFSDRILVCRIGERYLGNVTGMWQEYNCAVKTSVCKFITKQMAYHHPKNAAKKEDGALSICDWDNWKDQIKRLYKFVDSVVVGLVRSKKSADLFPDLVPIASNLLHLLSALHLDSIEASEPSTQVSSARKRRRLVTSYEELVEELRSKGAEEAVIPWLQVLTHFVSVHIEVVSPSNVKLTFTMLSSLLLQCRVSSVLKHLLSCFSALLDSSLSAPDLTPPKKEIQIAWELALKALSLNQCEKQCDDLLSKILTLKILPLSLVKLLPEDMVRGRISCLKSSQAFAAFVANYPVTTELGVSIDCHCADFCKQFSYTEHQAKVSLIRTLVSGLSNETSSGAYQDLPLEFIFNSLMVLCSTDWAPPVVTVQRKEGNESRVEGFYLQGLLLEPIVALVIEEAEEKRENENVAITACLYNLAWSELMKLCNEISNATSLAETPEQMFQSSVRLVSWISLCSRFEKASETVPSSDSQSVLPTMTHECERRLLESLKSQSVKISQKQLGFDELTQAVRFSPRLASLFSDDFFYAVVNCLAPPSPSSTPLTQMQSSFSFSAVQSQLDATQNLDWTPIEEGDTESAAHRDVFDTGNLSDTELFRIKIGILSGELAKATEERAIALLEFIQKLDTKDGVVVLVVFEVLDIMLKCSCGSVTPRAIEEMQYTLQGIAGHWYNDSEIMAKFLAIMRKVIEHLKCVDDSVVLEASMDLLKPFPSLLTSSSLGPEVAAEFFNCLVSLQAVDPLGEWATFESDANALVPALCILEVSTKLSLKILWHGVVALANVKLDRDVFEDVISYETKIVEKMSDLESLLGKHCVGFGETMKTSITLQLYNFWLFHFKWLNQMVFTRLNVQVAEKGLEEFVLKTTRLWAKLTKVNFSDLTDKLMPSCLYNWLRESHLLENFPHRLLGCACHRAFLRDLMPAITYALLSQQTSPDLQAIAAVLGLSTERVILSAFAEVVAVAVMHTGSSEALIEQVKRTVGDSVFADLLSQKIGPVAAVLIRHSFDGQMISDMLNGGRLPMSFQGGKYTTPAVYQTLETLPSVLSRTGSAMEDLLKRNPLGFHQLFSDLFRAVRESVFYGEKILSLGQFGFFTEMVLSASSSLPSSRIYVMTVLNEAFSSFLHDPDLTGPCLKILSSYIENCLEQDSVAFAHRGLDGILDGLCLAVADLRLRPAAVKILERLAAVPEVLKELPHLPKIPELANFQQHQEIVKGCSTLHSVHVKLQTSIEQIRSLRATADDFSDLSTYLRLRRKHVLQALSSSGERLVTELVVCLIRVIQKMPLLSASALHVLSELPLHCVRRNSFPLIDSWKLQTEEILDVLASAILSRNSQSVSLAALVLSETVNRIEFLEYWNTVESEHYTLRDFFLPFAKGRKPSQSIPRLDPQELELILSEKTVWSGDISYSQWVTKLVNGLLRSTSGVTSLEAFLPLCEASPEVCEGILQYALDCLVRVADSDLKNNLNNRLSLLISTLSRNFNDERKPIAIQVLRVVEYLRSRFGAKGPLEKGGTGGFKSYFRLDLDYLELGSLALKCDHDFLSVIYTEVGISQLVRAQETGRFSVDRSTFEHVLNLATNIDISIDVVCEALQKIGLSDEARALEVPKLQDVESVAASVTTSTIPVSIISRLQNAGLHSLLRPLVNSDNTLGEYQYECAWRLREWNLNVETPTGGFQERVYSCLKSVRFARPIQMQLQSGQLKSAVAKEFRDRDFSSLNKLLPVFGELSICGDIDRLLSLLSNGESAAACLEVMCDSSRKVQQEDTTSMAYRSLEQLLALRSVLAMELFRNAPEVNELHLTHSDIAFQFGDYNSALRYLAMIADTSSIETSRSLGWEVTLRKSKIAWCKLESSTAIRMIQPLVNLAKSDSTKPKSGIAAKTLLTYSKWLRDSQTATTTVIISDYLIPALQDARSTKDIGLTAECTLRVAEYTDSLVDACLKSLNSEETQRKVKLVQARAADLEKLQKEFEKLPERSFEKTVIHKRKYWIQKENEVDQKEIEELRSKKNKYALEALRYYMEFLTMNHSIPSNSATHRLVSIWLNSANNQEVCGEFEKRARAIPSHNFLPLIPQLTARGVVNASEQVCEGFKSGISSLVERCGFEHPHHVLPSLLALQMSSEHSREDTERIAAAKWMILKLKATIHVGLIVKMEQLYKILIDLSNTMAKDSEKYELPKNHPLLTFTGLETIPPMTYTIPVRLNGDYQNLLGTQRYSSTVSMVGGMNAPKKLEVLGKDGKRRYELLKGRDDTRQDAVMEQVFTFVNTCLVKEREARERQLKIRTYKVVPLSSQSGVIEWVDNTQPLADWLNKAHSSKAMSYYPSDLSADQAYSEMKKVSGLSESRRVARFKEICTKMRPVFHHYFLEKYYSAPEWLEKRTQYTRSVASSSMVGYILGIGDRHTSNILIDNATAELVHIDFGYAFDQGLVLPTPERVPFRLTRDIVDGMGISGVEGTFRKCCEITMSILRENYRGVLTLLEVLLYDPVYLWEMTPTKVAVVQKKRGRGANESRDGSEVENPDQGVSDGEVRNNSAQRVLSRVLQKLQGVEGDVTLSVTGQVNLLIQQARDPDRLGLMFAGWKAYL